MGPDGAKPTYYGVFTGVSAQAFPCTVATMTVAWSMRTAEPCVLRLRLVSPTGEVLHDLDAAKVSATRDVMVSGYNTITQEQFPEPGEYRFELLSGDQVVGSTPVFVSIRGEDTSHG